MGKDGKFTKKYAHGPKSVRNVMLYTQLKTTKSVAKIRMARIERNFGQKKSKVNLIKFLDQLPIFRKCRGKRGGWNVGDATSETRRTNWLPENTRQGDRTGTGRRGQVDRSGTWTSPGPRSK